MLSIFLLLPIRRTCVLDPCVSGAGATLTLWLETRMNTGLSFLAGKMCPQMCPQPLKVPP